MAYCEVIRKKQYEKYEMIRRRNNWDEQVLRYINDSKSWDYSFENEFSISDCEQSFLSRAVFAILMGVPLNKVVANVIYILDDSVYWYFDVMHNPKIDKNDQNRLASKLGLDSVERYKWEKIYHTIGNFSPIPWPKEKWFSGRHLQWYHAKPCHENWSIFLSDLQNHWGEMKEYKTINFKEYIKRTYQHLYCEEVFCDLKKDLIENNLDLKCIDW